MENTQTTTNKSETRRTSHKKRSGGILNFFLGNVGPMGRGDFLLILFTLMLLIFGLIMVFSSSYYYSISKEDSPYTFLFKQGALMASGAVLFFVAAIVDYKKWKFFAPIFAVVGLIMLLLIFTPLGHEINYATRWLKIGSFTFMPGEFAKLFAIIFTAWYLSKEPDMVRTVRGVLVPIALGGTYAILIVKQPNLSTAITVVGIVGCIMVVAGLHKLITAGAFGMAFLGAFALTTVGRHTYWYERFVTFLDPFADKQGDGYQVVQSLLAIGSGGLTGVGLGKSVQKNLYLPEPQNDFILAIIGEELGFIGIALLMILYCAFLWRGVHIALHARDQFGMLLASGIVIMVAIQVILNVAVVTSSMPPTGITLPLISYGGNALWMFMFSIGILVNISRHNSGEERRAKERIQD